MVAFASGRHSLHGRPGVRATVMVAFASGLDGQHSFALGIDLDLDTKLFLKSEYTHCKNIKLTLRPSAIRCRNQKDPSSTSRKKRLVPQSVVLPETKIRSRSNNSNKKIVLWSAFRPSSSNSNISNINSSSSSTKRMLSRRPLVLGLAPSCRRLVSPAPSSACPACRWP